MPALTVSVVTCDGSGFSMKRRMRPPSPSSTRPKAVGSGTRVRYSVAAEPRASWKASIAPRSASVRMSPLSTSTRPSATSTAWRTPPAVPSGSSSTAYDSRTPQAAPSPMVARTASTM